MPLQAIADLLDALPILFAAVSPSGKVIHVNRTMREVTGYPDLLSNQYALALALQGERVSFLDLIRRLTGLAEPFVHVGHLLTRTGEAIHVRWSGTLARNVEGPVACLCGVSLTDTNRKLHAEREEIQQEEQLREREGLFRLLAESAGDAILVVDGQGSVRFWNDAASTIFEYSSEEMVGSLLQDRLVLLAEKLAVEAGFAKSRGTCQGPFVGRTVECVGRTKTGGDVPIEVSISGIHHRGDWHLVGIARDISERRRNEAKLRKISSAIEQIADHAVITDKQGCIEYVNAAFEQITGHSREEAIGQNLRIVKSGRQNSSFYSAMWETILAGRVYHGDLINRNGRGELYFDELTISPLKDQDGEITHFVATGRDVTDRKMRDPLTGLPTRTLLVERVDRAIARKRRDEKACFALLFIDIDRFKLVNDTYGVTGGDYVLAEIAQRVTVAVRQADSVTQVSHLDRDEFAVLLEDIRDLSDGRLVAERVLASIRRPVQMGADELVVTASIGIALSSTSYTDPNDMLRDAETAMRRAKAKPDHPCQVFDFEMHALASARLQLEKELRHAIDAGELVLHYQPIVSLATGMIEGCEALVRWQHPKRGMVPPMDFIPLAEETGLIVPLGMFVLRRACEQLKEWLDSGFGGLTVAVNLSAKQFHQTDLIEAIRGVLNDTGLPPSLLKLELTESAAAADPKAVVEILTRLKAIGIQLLMDDFGTGYSSLSYLTRFPPSALTKKDPPLLTKRDPPVGVGRF